MKTKNIFLTAALVAASFTTYAQVGVGTTTTSAALDIVSTGATGATKALEINNSAATELVTVLDNGNVGIGEVLPTATLNIVSRLTSLEQALSVKHNALSLFSISNLGTAYFNRYTAATAITIRDMSSTNGLIASPIINFSDANNNSLGYVGDGSGGEDAMHLVSNTGAVNIISGGSGGLTASKIQLYTNGGSGAVPRMTILDNGNVGIGIGTPNAPLEVRKLGEALRISGTVVGDSNFTFINFTDSAGTSFASIGDSSGSNSDFSVYTPNSVSIRADGAGIFFRSNGGGIALTVDGVNKRTGVGTDTPLAELDVVGAIRLSDTALAPQPGMIKFDGTNFLGYNGSAWVQLN